MNLPTRPFLRQMRTGLALLLAALAASCGGGTQIEAFTPNRLIVFGDEFSTLDDSATPGNARKYTVNALKTGGALDCASNQLWVQTVAGAYGFLLEECNPNAVTNIASRVYAAAGARATDIATQVNAHLAASDFGPKDLVTVMAGQHDIIDAYAQFPGVGEPALIAQVEAAGAALGAQVNRIAKADGRVLVVTALDVGLTPYALAQDTLAGDASRSALLTRLSDRFNARLRTTLPADGGRRIGLVLGDELVQSIVRSPAGFASVTAPACDASKAPLVQNCTSATLVSENAALNHLWADDRLVTPVIHQQLGLLAVAQSRRNPF